MTRNLLIAATIVVSGTGAFAQELEAPQAPAPQAAPGAAQLSRERVAKIYLIRQLEGILTSAVKTGATALANQLKVAEPTSLFVTGNARARGFELDGYGVVFDVDVPTMMQSVMWSTQTLQRQEQINQLQEAINDPRTSDGMRALASNELRRLNRVMVQAPPLPPVLAGAQPVAQGMVTAQTSDNTALADTRTASATPPADSRSPDEMYTDVIRNALVDAMLSFGPALRLGDDEWLTVAARATAQAIPNQLDDSSSIVIRVKGADLSAYLLKKLTREEVIKKIEIKEG